MSDLGHCTPVMESHFNKVAGLKVSKSDSNTGVFLVLVYFTTRVPDTSDTSATRVSHECDTSATRVLHERHECNTSEKLWF